MTDINSPVDAPAVSPAPKYRYGRMSLLCGVLGLLLSQVTLYAFIFTGILAPLTAGGIILMSLGGGFTLFSAGLAIITGHRTIHQRVTITAVRQGTIGLIFGYGTLLVLALTIVLGVTNSNTLQENSNPTTACTQGTTTVVCHTE